jgi:hypothetical protein
MIPRIEKAKVSLPRHPRESSQPFDEYVAEERESLCPVLAPSRGDGQKNGGYAAASRIIQTRVTIKSQGELLKLVLQKTNKHMKPENMDSAVRAMILVNLRMIIQGWDTTTGSIRK